MFFVAYLKVLGKNVVLPATWICNIENHFENFVNNSINSNQAFLCYYTTNEDAFSNGCPIDEFAPNFRLPMVQRINDDGSFDGCFLAKLRKFRSKHLKQNEFMLYSYSNHTQIHIFCFYLENYDDAIVSMHRLRNVEPAIYNSRRLAELPLPSAQNGQDSVNSSNNESFVSNREHDDIISGGDSTDGDRTDRTDASIQLAK